MSFNILKNIILVNLKKNWIMILTFFVFLIVSCSMLFGMTSFIIGMRAQIPQESFNQNKDFITFNAKGIIYKQDKDQPYAYQLNDEGRLAAQISYKELLKESGSSKQYSEADLENIMNGSQTNDQDAPRQSGVIPKDIDTDGKITAKMIEDTGYANFNTYFMETYVLPKGILNSKVANAEAWIVNTGLDFSERAGYGDGHIEILNNKDGKYIRNYADDGFYEHSNYKNKSNVLFTNHDTENRNHYKVGQTVELVANGRKGEFLYGGIYAPDLSKTYANAGKDSYYYINNLTKDNGFYEGNPGFTNPYFKLYWAKAPNGQKLTAFLNSNESPFHKLFMNPLMFSDVTTRFSTYKMLYTALFMLTIVFIVILVILDVILSWFLIKEIINNLSGQLLFLKAMGLKDSEASLINALSILLLLVSGIGLALAGMLGVQFVFTNMITNFMDVILKWNVIQPMSLILVFGLLAFLFVVYFISNYLLVSKLNLASNRVVRKSEFWFSRTKAMLFNKDINAGITLSFNIKNLSKMIVAFVITLLMVIISFVSIQFDQSMDKNAHDVQAFNNNKATYSYEEGISNYSYDDSDVSENVQYKNMNQADDPDANITDPTQIFMKGQGSYIKSSTIDEWYKHPDKNNGALAPGILGMQADDWTKLKEKIDFQLNEMWPHENHDFSLNIGVMYKNNADVDRSVMLNDTDRLIILNDDDKRAKDLFKNTKDTFKTDNYLPIACSYGEANQNSWKTNQILDSLQISLSNETSDQHSLKPKMKIGNESTDIASWQLFYVRQSDFISYLKYANDPVGNYMLNPEHGIPFNSYLNDGIPNVANQILINLDDMSNPNLADAIMRRSKIIFVGMLATSKRDMIHPLVLAMIIILVLGIVLMLAFIIFMNMTIMSENDSIIFIMKALGYSRSYILWRIVSGYFLAIGIGLVAGILISWALLGLLNGAFLPVLFANISFLWTWPIIVLIVGLVIVLGGITLGISATKISKRSLTVREE